MSIVTLAQAKAQLNIDPGDTSADEELQDYVDGITGVVEDYKNEVIEPRPIIEEFPSLNGICVLSHTPVIGLISVEGLVGSQVWDISGLHADPTTGRVTALSGARLSGALVITYKAGYTTIPGRYQRGALIILQHVWETQRGIAGVQSGAIGEEELHDRLYSFSIPRKALEWLGSQGVAVA